MTTGPHPVGAPTEVADVTTSPLDVPYIPAPPSSSGPHATIPQAGDPPHMDIEATLTQLTKFAADLRRAQKSMDRKMTGITELTPEQIQALQEGGGAAKLSATIDAYEKRLSPMRKAWAFIGGLFAVAMLIFGVGVSYQQFMGGNATKNDIEEHVADDLEPVRADVKAIQDDLVPVKTGVEILVKTQEDEHAVKKLKRKLNRYDKEHSNSLAEDTADKAARRPAGPRPKKSPAHIDLEDKVQELEDKL